MSILKRAKQARINSGDWQLINMNPSQVKVLQKLSLLPQDEVPTKRSPGRPKKNV